MSQAEDESLCPRVCVGADQARAFASAMGPYRRAARVVLAGLLATLAAAPIVYGRVTGPIRRFEGHGPSRRSTRLGRCVTLRGPSEGVTSVDNFPTLIATVDRE